VRGERGGRKRVYFARSHGCCPIVCGRVNGRRSISSIRPQVTFHCSHVEFLQSVAGEKSQRCGVVVVVMMWMS
jgi:hypothetical protein